MIKLFIISGYRKCI